MKSVKRALREGLYEALNGIVSATVYESFENVNPSEDVFISFGNISEGRANTFTTFTTEATADINICHRTHNAFSHETVDDLEGEVLDILIPQVDTPGFSVTDFQVINAVKVASDYVDEDGEEGNISRIVLRIQVTLIEQ